MAPKNTRDPKTHAGAALGGVLRRLRESAGIRTVDEMAKVLGTEISVAGQAETGKFPPTEANLGVYLDTCKVTDTERDAITALWHIAKAKQDPGRQRVAPWYETEQQAHTLMYWALALVPGFLQIREYAETLYRARGHAEERVAELTEGRLARRSLLDRDDPPDISVVLWEAVFSNPVGPPEVMRTQIARLLEVSGLPFVHLQVLRYDPAANAGVAGAFSLAHAYDSPDLLLTGGIGEDQVTDDRMKIREATRTFNQVRVDALREGETRDFLRETMEQWNS